MVEGLGEVEPYFLATCDQQFNWAAAATEGYSCQLCGLLGKKKIVVSADGINEVCVEVSVRQSPPFETWCRSASNTISLLFLV